MINFISEPQILTNLVYILPIAIAFVRGFWLETFAVAISMVTSIIYHSFSKTVDVQWFFLRNNVGLGEYVFGFFDYIFGIAITTIFAHRLLMSNVDGLTLIIITLLFLVGFVIFLGPTYFHFLKRWSVTSSHSLWHVISGLIAAIALLQ
jgi:hypothetical protein